jgi:hypothetical protein
MRNNRKWMDLRAMERQGQEILTGSSQLERDEPADQRDVTVQQCALHLL